MLVRKWGDSFESPVISTGEDRYVMYTSRGRLEGMIESNFSVLDEVRNIDSQIDFPASISIGIGSSDLSLIESTELAEAALELALGRGGDQAVVKTDDGTKYYGGTLQSFEKNNRSKPRVIAHAMKALINDADKVFVMGHKWPDMDAFGAAIGASAICKFLGKDTFIVMDKHNEALDAVYDLAADTDDYSIIKSERALKGVTDKSLLIIVDTNRPMLVESYDLVKACSARVIIDHHRMTEDSFKNASVAYIESYASSASELMAELIQNFAQKRFITKFEAEALLAGIMVDTNNFSGRTGVRTFEAAAWLRKHGADTVAVKLLFQNDLSATLSRYEILQHAELYRKDIALCCLDHPADRIIAAQAADELLNISGIQASFVFYPDGDQVICSARSIGEANVQMILEPLGGGGNQATAGAQIKGMTPEEVREALKRSIDNFFSE